MKINFTKKQYENLVKLSYFGNWLRNARFTQEEDEYDKDIDDLDKYIRSFAKDFGHKKLTFDKILNEYYFDQKGEFELHEYVLDYDDENFWKELPYRLARRDFVELYEDQKGKMEQAEVFKKMDELEEKYYREFEKNGLKNLYVNFLSPQK